MMKPEAFSDGDPSVEHWRLLMEERGQRTMRTLPQYRLSQYPDLTPTPDPCAVLRERIRNLEGDPDPVSMPSHYTQLPVECIDVTEHFGFCLGNAIKYIWRADHKGKPLEDLRKARWYIDREIARREREQ